MFYKWLETDDHSVKNFNKIFNLSQLKDFPDNSDVDIGEIHIGGLREVFVCDKKLLVELKSSNMKILVERNSPKPALNKNEEIFVNFLATNGDSSYRKLKDYLGMTANVLSKTLFSLKTKQVVQEIGKSVGRNSSNKIIKLIKY